MEERAIFTEVRAILRAGMGFQQKLKPIHASPQKRRRMNYIHAPFLYIMPSTLVVYFYPSRFRRLCGAL